MYPYPTHRRRYIMSIIDTFDSSSNAIINASDMVNPIDNYPDVTIAVFNRKFLKILLEKYDAEKIRATDTGCSFPLYRFEHQGIHLAFACVTRCGPGAAGDLEELLAIGAKTVLFFGSAGALFHEMNPGQIIVPAEAYRDDGVSYHYAPSSDFIVVPTAEKLASLLSRHGIEHQVAKTWTTDAFYRETKQTMEKRKAAGCVVVEQECASVMAVGQFRNADIYQFLYVADCLDGEHWDSRILGKTPEGIRIHMLDIAVKIAVGLSYEN